MKGGGWWDDNHHENDHGYDYEGKGGGKRGEDQVCLAFLLLPFFLLLFCVCVLDVLGSMLILYVW